MSAYIYRLSFLTPVHFGAVELGGGLEETALGLSSDTLVSAMLSELGGAGCGESVEMLCQLLEDGAICFSDLLPYRNLDGETQLFLPRPMLLPEDMAGESPDGEETLDYAETKRAATQRKRLKKMEYLRASLVDEFLASAATRKPFDGEAAEFGERALRQRVACRGGEPRPYSVMEFSFAREAGLYLVARCETEEQAAEIAEILTLLGISGIGGKRSAGYGKFKLVNGAEPLEGTAGSDAAALAGMLERTDGWQMAIASLLPSAEEIMSLKAGHYRIVKRGGFLSPEAGAAAGKKNSVYMVAAGSCFPRRLEGSIAVLARGSAHDVYRAGKGFFVGVRA